MTLYSVKMRGARQEKEKSIHISGAEKLVSEKNLVACTSAFLDRALYHSKGQADFINLKVEKVAHEEILYLEALPVSTIVVNNPLEGTWKLKSLLEEIDVPHVEVILEKMQETYGMRGAMLLNVDTMQRLEPDEERGLRATYMDQEEMQGRFPAYKNHFQEALVLATKVAHAPGIIAEICISDDPDYVTGYIASATLGYVRISQLKEKGSPNGGRIFLYKGSQDEVPACIRYLEKQKVIVKNMPQKNTISSPNILKKDKWERLEAEIKGLKQKELYRQMRELESAQSAYVTYKGRQVLMLASNSYLDLCNETRIKAFAAEALQKYGVGSGGARLTTGNTTLYRMLEERLAQFKGTEAALLFNTGYMANVGIITALCDKQSVIFSDALNHASIIDGARLSGAKIIIYAHNDMADLEEKVKANPCEKGLIVSDAVFSMDGDIVNLPLLVKIAKKYGLFSMIDEAHATGVIGEGGKGIVSYYKDEAMPDILMGTLSKALGSEGGFVCGSKLLIDYLRNKARSFIFSTALAPVNVAAALKALEIIEAEPWRVKKLQENVSYFCEMLKKQGVSAVSSTAIIPIHIGDAKKACEIANQLLDEGYYVSAIRYPTVKQGEARLRIALMATHTKEVLDEVAHVIAKAINS